MINYLNNMSFTLVKNKNNLCNKGKTMNKINPRRTFYSSIFITTIFTSLLLSGCGAKQEEKVAKTQIKSEYLTTFLSLHNEFCERKYKSSDLLKQTLKKASELKLADNFEGVYEVTVGDVSFAVSPEDDGCTTDVMVKDKKNQLLFTFEDINEALLKQGYIETGEPESRKDLGIDQSELTIIEKKYISPSGEVTVLDYPLVKQDKYYMTLFAEKFLDERHRSKEAFMKSLRMASL